MQYMRETIKKFIRKNLVMVVTVIFFILNTINTFFRDEIKSALLQLNITLPVYDVLTIIFATGIIVGSILFVVERVSSLRKSKGIKFYNSRNELPRLKNILLQAKQEISFLGVTLEKIIGEEESIIIETIERGVHMKFLILDSESKLISKRDESMTGTKDAVTSTLARICKIKSKLSESDKDKCEIRTYDLLPLHSIIALDLNSDDAMISVELQLYDVDTKSRPSIRIYKKKQEELFTKYLKHYNYFLNKSVEYQCQNR